MILYTLQKTMSDLEEQPVEIEINPLSSDSESENVQEIDNGPEEEEHSESPPKRTRRRKTMTPKAINQINEARKVVIANRKIYAQQRREWAAKEKELQKLKLKEYEYGELLQTISQLKDKVEKPPQVVEKVVERVVEKMVKTTSFGSSTQAANTGFKFKRIN
jgi:hypothetical protein